MPISAFGSGLTITCPSWGGATLGKPPVPQNSEKLCLPPFPPKYGDAGLPPFTANLWILSLLPSLHINGAHGPFIPTPTNLMEGGLSSVPPNACWTGTGLGVTFLPRRRKKKKNPKKTHTHKPKPSFWRAPFSPKSGPRVTSLGDSNADQDTSLAPITQTQDKRSNPTASN